MKTAQCLITFFLIFTNSSLAHADYLPNQDTEIVGKKLWIYYDLNECRESFKIYRSKSTNDALQFNEVIEVEVNELNKTPFNWSSGAWYDLTVRDSSSTQVHITYSDMNSNAGYTKSLYFANINDVDTTLLKNACITNISPKERLAIFEKEKEKIKSLEAQRNAEDAERHKIEVERKKVKAEAEAEALRIKKQNDDIRIAKLLKERREEDLKSAPEFLKELADNFFCESYGDYLRGDYLTGLGTAEDIKPIITKEVKRRKLKFNTALIKEKSIKLGMTTCELYASLGRPESENRSVGSYGVHIQHVYGSGFYVYSENGIVSSWQD